jgi:hypothetical protein
MKSFCIFDSHHLYLQLSESASSSHSIYSHLRRRYIPSITSLHESMRSLQRRIAHLSRRVISGTEKRDTGESYLTFGESFSLVASASVSSYLTCSSNIQGTCYNSESTEHVGQCRAFFDPLSREWVVWNTCCGKGRIVLTLSDEILQENILKTIFEYTPCVPPCSLSSKKFC